MLPLLYERFESLCLTPDLYLVDWKLSVFTRALPLDACAHVWDAWIHSGEAQFVRAALGVLRALAPRLAKAR